MNYLRPEERELGKANFRAVLDQLHTGPLGDRRGRRGMTRRDFLLTAASVPAAAGALYFGYEKWHGKPVRAGLIGSGDEGLVLLTESNPDFVEFIAYSDIRPSNQKRALEGDPPGRGPRLGFRAKYGSEAAKAIARRSESYHDDYRRLLEDKDIELVVIALPLHLHAKVAIEAMQAGKHVLCEKLMARYITNRWQTTEGSIVDRSTSGAEEIPGCKAMIRVARETGRLLAIGHQRHYSILYDGAYDVIQQGLLGDIRHIRALWHRNNRPGRDSWNRPIPEEDQKVDVKRHGYKSLRELVNWRLYQRTGGGLMAELGSHQLDACSIFLGKKHPLFVSGVGGKYYYQDDREVEDHVFCTFEFPGKSYDPRKDPRDNDIVVVTYSSINTNAFEGYGECVLGTDATLIVDSEREVLLFKERGAGKHADGPPRSTYVRVVEAGGSAGVQLDASATQVGVSTAVTRVLDYAATSRGYREELEHMAYCIRNPDPQNQPRCSGEVALADAVIALAANLAMKLQKRIPFHKEWFDPNVTDPSGDPWTDPRILS
ncbi:MAG: gfo/Idh/MocA family oxidoreductase [Gemmataceae bacterium]